MTGMNVPEATEQVNYVVLKDGAVARYGHCQFQDIARQAVWDGESVKSYSGIVPGPYDPNHQVSYDEVTQLLTVPARSPSLPPKED